MNQAHLLSLLFLKLAPMYLFLCKCTVYVQFEPADRGQDAKLEKTMYHYLEI